MRFERLTSKDHPLYEKALELYRISFPAHEQREASSQADILSDEQYHFTLVYHDDAFAGLILFWETQKFIYVEHFCILPQMRNQKLGQTALQLLGQRQKAVILEIDPPDDEISQRRKRFYERCGFRVLDYECALFGVHFNCLYRGPQTDDRAVEQMHRGVYAAWFSGGHMERYIQLPLKPGEAIIPAPEWVEEDDNEETI